MENQRNYQLLDQFAERKCEVCFHSLLESIVSATYVYQNFTYYIDSDNQIYFQDQTEEESNTYFELDKVIEITNLWNDDVYHDVITFKTNEFVIDICLLEKEPKYPICQKCGKDILIPEAVNWHVCGYDCYENPYDGYSDVVNGLSFCSDCIAEFVGEIEVPEEPDCFGGEYHE